MSQAHPGPDRGSTAGTPRWVKAFGIVALALVLLFVVLQFAAGGGHGPGRHLPTGGLGSDTAPSSVTENQAPDGDGPGGHTPPEGGHR